MRPSGKRVGLATLGAIALIVLPSGVGAHRLPRPPLLELLASLADPGNPGLRTYVVQVIEGTSGKPVTLDEPIRASAREAGSGLEAGPVGLRPTGPAGVFAGQLLLPRDGRWQVRLEVVGIPSQLLVFEEQVGGAGPAPAVAGQQARPTGDPELWDGVVVGYLIRQWAHLLGFALWLGAALLLRFGLPLDVRVPLILLWGGLGLAHATALDKMWYSTPPFHETPYIWNYASFRDVPVAGQYALVLFAKQMLAVTAVILAIPLTKTLLRAARGEGKTRAGAANGLIWAQIVLALAIAALAVTLDMLHKVVDHFLS